MGEPDAIAAFVGDAEILVTHLAPVSASMLDRLPELRLIAVSRGGPVNIDMAAARARGVRGGQHAGPQRLGGRRVHDRRDPRRDPPDPRRPRGAAQRRVARRPLPRRHDRRRAVGDDRRRHRLRPHRHARGASCSSRSAAASWSPIPTSQLSAEDRDDGVEHVGLDRLLAESDVVTLHARVTDGDPRLHRRRRLRAHAAGRLLHQHGARADGRLRRAARRAGERPSARRHAGNLLAVEPVPPDCAAAAPAERHPDAAHRRRLPADRADRRRR